MKFEFVFYKAKQYLLNKRNNDNMKVKLVTDYVDIAAENKPNKIGFIDEKRECSFLMLRKEALKVATAIVRRGLIKEPIAIYLNKSVEAISTAFGVMYSNNFYTFLDIQMPKTRVEKICNVLVPKLIITDAQHVSDIEELNIDYIVIENIMCGDIDEEAIKCRVRKAIDSDIAYVLFTSGSTGIPKGVIISHRNIITYMDWSTSAFGFSDETVIGNQTPFYFSMSVLDIFQTVRSWATMVIIPKRLFTFPIELMDYLEKMRINTIYWVPSALCQVANMGALEKKVDCLEKVLFAGEVMPTKQLNLWRQTYPHVVFANLFGPTEVTDICTYYVLKRKLDDTESVPIGNSCDNMDCFIVDSNGELVTDLSVGELYVRGASVAYGYYNDPEKTKEVFVQNPLHNLYEEKVYKTGDLVRYNEYGELTYVSRKDFQIKHMGYRIELGEIENTVSSFDNIKRVCCIYDHMNSCIVLFYEGDVEKKQLKKMIKEYLPKYMIPSKIYQVDTIPLNMNGKIDRAELKSKLGNCETR